MPRRSINRLLTGLIRFNIFLLALKKTGKMTAARDVLKKLRNQRVRLWGHEAPPKVFLGNGKLFINPNIPGWPSEPFQRFFSGEIERIAEGGKKPPFPHIAIFSVTARCPLRCNHCFEWERLSGKDTLTFSQLSALAAKYENAGVVQFQLGGGEPLMRSDELERLIKSLKAETWLLTSGYGMTPELALRLKKAGLTGVKISLDHYIPEKHNSFRGNSSSFSEAVRAVAHCRKAGLATGVALCMLSENATEEFLMNYLVFANNLGASFVFLLEPRETGHFKNMEVTLSDEECRIISDFYVKVNSEKKFGRMPYVIYPGYHQRITGCFGAGLRYIYIDSNGSAHACPFCQGSGIDAVNTQPQEVVALLRREGCHMFATAEIV